MTYTTPGAPSNFVVTVNTSTLPTGATLTTDNVEAVSFTALGQLDCNNNFGYETCPNAFVSITPSSSTVCVGGAVTLSSTVSGGNGSCTRQWQSGPSASGPWTNISGATAATYNAPTATAGTFYYRATYACTGSTCAVPTSNVATVVITPDPTISIAPSSSTVCVGGTVTLTATPGNGTGTCTIQWQSGTSAGGPWTNISGANAATYSAPTTTAGTRYYRATYSCTGNGCGAANSATATVVVTPDPTISITPSSSTVCVGGTVTLTATPGNGTGTCTIQWQSGTSASGPWTNISGANATTYSAPTTTAGTRYYRAAYSCTGSGCNVANSATATVVVTADPTISITPASSTVCVGGTATLTATPGNGTGTCTIQWQSGTSATGPWTNISGANATTYNAPTTTAGTRHYRATYSCTGSGCDAANSATATVVVTPDPTISITPSSSTVCVGGTVTLTATPGNGTGTCTIQWQSGTSASGPWTNISGANATTYNVPTTTAGTRYYRATYSCTGSGCDAANSATATVVINALPNNGLAVSDAAICIGQTATITITGSQNGVSYQLRLDSNDSNVGAPVAGNGGAINITVSPTATTLYNILATNTTTNCFAELTDKPMVTVNPLPNNGLAVTDDAICAGEMASITITGSQSGVSYQLRRDNNDSNVGAPVVGTGGNITIMVSPASTTLYNILATNTTTTCAAELTDKPTVTVEDPLDPGTNGALSICAGETVTAAALFAALGGTPDPGGIWTPALAGGGTYTYTHAATANCPATSAQVVVTETAGPDAGTNGTLMICQGETVTTAELFNALGGTPDPGGVWTPALAGAGVYTYTHAAVGACPLSSAQVVVTEETPETAGSNGSREFCEGTNTLQNLFDIITGEDPGGSWAGTTAGPSSGVMIGAGTAINFSAAAPGVYQFTYTIPATAACPAVSATATITVTNRLLAGPDNSDEFCEGSGQGYNLTELLSGADAGGTWAQTSGATVNIGDPSSVDFSAAAPGTYIFTYTHAASGSCPADVATLTITVTNQLLAGIDNSDEFCEGSGAAYNLTALLSGADAGGAWAQTGGIAVNIGNPASVNFSGAAPGVYTFTYTHAASGSCAADVAVFTITVTNQLLAGTDNSDEFCEGSGAAYNLVALLSGADAGGVWAQTSGAAVNIGNPSSVNFSGAAPGVYTFTYTHAASGSCPADMATFTITVTNQLLAGPDNNDLFCAGSNANYDLTALLSGADAGGTWSQTGGDMVNSSNPANVNFSAAAPGMYTFSYTHAASGSCPAEVSVMTITIEYCCPEVPIASVGTVECVNGTTYQYTFAASLGATVASANGTISGNLVMVAVGTNDVLTVYNDVNCEAVTLNITSPTICNISCEQPNLTVGNSVCNGATYSVSFTETTGATITTAPGTYTITGNVISGIPLGTNVVITATNPNDGACNITLTAISPTDCGNLCPDELISVSALGVCSADGLTYSVNFVLAPGATLTTEPMVGTIGSNVIMGIPAGTNIRLVATNAGCNKADDILITDPNCCPDAPIASVGSVVCLNGTTYQYTFAASPGATVVSANGTISGNTVTLTVGANDVLTVYRDVNCDVVTLNVDSPANCNLTCEQPNLTLGNSVCNGATYSVSFTETTGATITTAPGIYTVTGNVISGIPLGTNVVITASNPNDGACAITLTAISPIDCGTPCPDELVSVSALGVCSTDGLTYAVNFVLAPGATLTTEPLVGTIGANVITGIPAGTNIRLVATNAACNKTDDIIVADPNCCPDEPIASLGSVVCVNGTTYQYTFAASPGATIVSANGTISGNMVTVAVGTNDMLTVYRDANCDVVTLNVTSPANCNLACDQPDLTVGNSVCNGTTYAVSFTETTGATITTAPAIYTITGNLISGIPQGTNVTITATNPNDGDCTVTLTVISPNDCGTPCPDELISVSALGVCATDGLTYSVNFFLSPGATLITDPAVGTIGTNVITGIPAGANIRLIATDAACNKTDDIVVAAPDCCPEAPVVSVGSVVCVDGTTYQYSFAASPGATVTSANGTIIGNTVTVAVGTNDVLTATNDVSCDLVTLGVASPATCVDLMCEQPDLTLGNAICAVTTYSIAFTETTGAVISTDPGTYTITGNVISGIPIGTNAVITATNPNDSDCAISLTATSPTALECAPCPEELISVSALGICSADGSTYSVNFALVAGATLTTDPEVGTIGANVITGIPAGTSIRLIATDAACNKTDDIVVAAPNCCVSIEAFVYLEGSLIAPQTGLYSTPMRTTLNASKLLPGQYSEDIFIGNFYQPILGASGQAYNVAPWNYAGTEGIGFDSEMMNANADAGYPSTVVDWVLVSLRSTPENGSEAICQRAGLLHNDGRIEFINDADCCVLDPSQSYYIVVEHRNHLIVMSHEAVPVVNNVLTYDFRNKQSYVNDPFSSGVFLRQKEVLPGVFAMYAGNGDHLTSNSEYTDITAADYTKWLVNGPANRVYNLVDYNMDGDVSALDFFLWLSNAPGFTSIIVSN
ncbi:hypothetical protein QWY85_06625 [Neolewinella lacunae]|uniref:beta strand repeat-containing protein n=1 Tax=Neolewinella lacunae TaxID=1517758 RepID=UPI001FE3C053|nr:hypothetical protein [Neolewinella lacunae]MDN3634324.1 hypothetical protein [Neolewinella lacunae]